MPRSPKIPEEIAAALQFFTPGAVQLVDRLLQRAAERAAREARSGSRHSGPGGIGTARAMAGHLATAMKRRGAKPWERPSAKHTAPDTGGRPYHVRHTQINKGRDGGRGPGTAVKAGMAAGRARPGLAAAHEGYIERESAVERAALAREPSSGGPRASRPSRDMVEGEGSAAAGQAYVENPAKVSGEDVETVLSFGNIGTTLSERMAFWSALEASERKGGRIQARLIIELPHEASSQARHDMVRRFCAHLEEMELPYWAALHAPTKDNDSRNHHCHVVYNEAPTKRMVDPADGEMKWDFEIVETYKTSSRHTRKRRPHRQNSHPFFRDKTAIRDMRGWVESAVNAVLERDGVTDINGRPVRYDARSYADMGLDVVPMATISRVALQAERRVRRGEFGGDVTRILAEAELQLAAASRDPALLEVYHLEKDLAALTRAPEPTQELKQALPEEMQGSWSSQPGTADVKQAADAMLATKRTAVADDILERSARMALDQILFATASDQEASSRSGSGDTAPGSDNSSDLAALRALHAVAQEELAQLDENAIVRKRRAKERVTAALQVWRNTIGAEQPDLIRPDQAVGQAAPVAAVTLPIMPEDLQRERLPDTAQDIASEVTSRAETPRSASATPAEDVVRPANTKKPLSEKARAERRAVLARRQKGRGR